MLEKAAGSHRAEGDDVRRVRPRPETQIVQRPLSSNGAVNYCSRSVLEVRLAKDLVTRIRIGTGGI